MRKSPIATGNDYNKLVSFDFFAIMAYDSLYN